MADSQITVFYSWQSDLPGSDTRNIIQDSIKDAVRLLRDTVDIEADRDTKGEFGFPDIAQTIFSKKMDSIYFQLSLKNINLQMSRVNHMPSAALFP